MPRYTRKRTYRKAKLYYRKRFIKRWRKRVSRKKITSLKLRTPSMIPDRMYVKLVYEDYYFVNTTGAATRWYRGNGPYDPDGSGVGHQPRGWDQWIAFYEKVTCTGSKIGFQFINTSTGEPIMVSFNPSKATTSPDVFQAELPYTINKMQGPVSSSNSNAYYKSYMSTQKMYGKKVMQEDNFSSSVSSLPVDQWNWVVYFQNPRDALAEVKGQLRIRITYYCVFQSRNQNIANS